MPELPDKFLERLGKIFAPSELQEILHRFESTCPATFRVNTLKADTVEIISRISADGISCHPIEGIKNAFSCPFEERKKLTESSLSAEGFIYMQSASSLLASIVLGPCGQDRVLDMCAAPGSKTSHMAALMNNAGKIIALESVKHRFFKLKNVLGLLGVSNVDAKLCDARRYRPKDIKFNKILVDAPCSSEGRFHKSDRESFAYWSERKIKEMEYKQKGILLRALELLQQGGELLYSTCTFAPEENEEVVDWALRKMNGEVELIHIPLDGVESYPALSRWGKREYDPDLRRCVRIRPQGIWEGFFMAKFKRV